MGGICSKNKLFNEEKLVEEDDDEFKPVRKLMRS